MACLVLERRATAFDSGPMQCKARSPHARHGLRSTETTIKNKEGIFIKAPLSKIYGVQVTSLDNSKILIKNQPLNLWYLSWFSVLW